jgi:hypothetical protein
VVKPVSPYLLRPLRSLQEALRELGQQAPDQAAPDASAKTQAESPPPPAPAKTTPQDTVTIGGVVQPIEPAEPTPPPTGTQLDVEA